MLKEINRESGARQVGLETTSAQISDHGMKRTYFPGIVDIVVVTEPLAEWVRGIGTAETLDLCLRYWKACGRVSRPGC